MTEPSAPERLSVLWSPEARVELRAIDRESALQILYCLNRYLANRTGDAKRLKPLLTGFRLSLRGLPRLLRLEKRRSHPRPWCPSPQRSLPLTRARI